MKKIEIKMITLIAIFSLSCFSNTFAFTLFQQSLSDRVVKSSIIGLKATYSTDDATKILEGEQCLDLTLAHLINIDFLTL